MFAVMSIGVLRIYFPGVFDAFGTRFLHCVGFCEFAKAAGICLISLAFHFSTHYCTDYTGHINFM